MWQRLQKVLGQIGLRSGELRQQPGTTALFAEPDGHRVRIREETSLFQAQYLAAQAELARLRQAGAKQ